MAEPESGWLILVVWWITISTIAAVVLAVHLKQQQRRDHLLAVRGVWYSRKVKLGLVLALYVIGPPLIMFSLGVAAWHWNRSRLRKRV